ncbi:hypothetical protein PIB30_035083 [Stylosanthes scabra]|uniref:RING-type domain-containing protein n=1 Tax=Stylosanthes scabra TaxID=79078 RepID=A0ABU6QCH3_9FABA|nr:hypothetical protein [Stylosanthes scabra]
MKNNNTYEMEEEESTEESMEEEYPEEEESMEEEEEEEEPLEEEEEYPEEEEESMEEEEEEEEPLEEEEEEEEEEPLEEEEEFLEEEEPLEEEEEEKEEEEDFTDDEPEIKQLSECTTPLRSCFTTLTESDIKKLQETEISRVSSVLLVPKSDACFLLIHHGWSAMNVRKAWVQDEERVRKLIGMLKNNSQEIIITQSCEICFDEKKMKSAAKCGHAYCVACWKHCIDEKIQEGPHECLKPMTP